MTFHAFENLSIMMVVWRYDERVFDVYTPIPGCMRWISDVRFDYDFCYL